MKSTTPIADLTAAARSGLSGSWGKSIGVIFVYMVLIFGVSLVPLAGKLLQFIFAAPLVVGLHMYFLSVVRKQANLLSLLFEGFDRFGVSLRAYLLVLLIIAAWMIPFGVLMTLAYFFIQPDPKIFPVYTLWALQVIIGLCMCGFLIILQMRYYQVLYIVADDPSVKAREAVRRSTELMHGNYWRLCLLWFRFIGWQLLVPFSLGIGLIWLIPYMSAATAAFYDDLSQNGVK